jgi:hypothetical protein
MIHGVTYILNTDATFQSRAGLNAAATKYKAYPVIAPQDEKAPYSICRMTSMQLQYKGRSVFECEFQVTSYHNNYDDVYALDNAVVEALVPIRGTYNGVNFGYIEHTGTTDDIAETYGILYVKVSTFNCSITKTALT